MKWRFAIGGACVAAAAPAWAGDAPLYQPAPAWVAPAAPIDTARLDDSSPPIVLFDSQQRVERGRVWGYVDTATRAATAQALGEMGTLTIPWAADKGDLIVHRVEILRGAERIDLLGSGKRFVVLRREENLEKRELTGILTATMAVEGLQVGDVLRVTVSITGADPALGGRAQAIMPLPALPNRIGTGRVRLSWPAAEPMRWHTLSGVALPAPKLVGGYKEVTLALPLPKPPEMPNDAPDRFARPPLLEGTSFADWAEVSRVMAPLYATEGLIAPGSPLAAEVAAIAKAETDPLRRAQRALELVQDKVRYLALGMNGGNYLPQKPADTWSLRYGDCKAKTVLLLAMLRAMGIEAEPVIVASRGGGLVPERLPMPGAFDHMIVRATVNGEALWLDGTRAGSRLADIRDTPRSFWALPLRAAGSGLIPVPVRADARPTIDVSLDFDETAAVDLPSVVRATVVARGEIAAMLAAANAQGTPEQRREMVTSMLGTYVGEAQLAESAVRYDPASGTATITATAVTTTPWKVEDRRRRRPLDRAVGSIEFNPDRARPEWAAIPVATGGPGSLTFRTRVRLPDGGKGYELDGDRDLSGSLGGVKVRRTVRFAGGVVELDERIDEVAAEIAPADLPAERARVALAKGRLLRIVAPADATNRWGLAARGEAATRAKAIAAVFDGAIVADPKEPSGYSSRANFRAGILDRKGAIADYGELLKLGPSADLYLSRAALHRQLGDDAAALRDIEAARKLDPGSGDVVRALASLRSDAGDHRGALALLDERIGQGGQERTAFQAAKADALAASGQVDAALKLLDEAIAAKPGDPMLLNQRCWIKGTRNVALDTALKDCTKAIELSEGPAAALDSRAMVWFRMGKTDDALADLDAALDAAPGQADSLFMRGVLRGRAGLAKEAAADLATARALAPQVDRDYRKYGITP